MVERNNMAAKKTKVTEENLTTEEVKELIEPAETTDVVEEVKVVTATVNTLLNFRKKAKVADNVICILPVGTVVTVKENAGDWSLVNFEGTDGYVMTEFITV